MLVCDTSRIKGIDYYTVETDTVIDGCQIDFIKKHNNYYEPNHEIYWVFGFSVREKHNTDEGKIDPYAEHGYVSRDYWLHSHYLDSSKKPLPKNIIVWDSKDVVK